MVYRLLLGLCCLLATLQIQAEQYVDQGEFRVHYAAINSSDLTPEVARQFGVQRTRNEILLVLNAQQRQVGGYMSVAATAEGHATTLLGHRQTLKLQPVQEAGVHYVIGSFTTLDGEFMTVEAKVRPAEAKVSIPIRFTQQFFRE